MNIFTKTQFTEWAEPIPASEVHPPCSRGAIVREPTAMETEGKRNGEVARKGGWSIGERYVHARTRKKSGPFPRSSDRSYALPPRARLFSFNRLPIFPRSIPPRGDLKGHCGSVRSLLRFIIPIIYLFETPAVGNIFTPGQDFTLIDIAEILASV